MADYPQSRCLLLCRGHERLKCEKAAAVPIQEFLAGARPGRDLW